MNDTDTCIFLDIDSSLGPRKNHLFLCFLLKVTGEEGGNDPFFSMDLFSEGTFAEKPFNR